MQSMSSTSLCLHLLPPCSLSISVSSANSSTDPKSGNSSGSIHRCLSPSTSTKTSRLTLALTAPLLTGQLFTLHLTSLCIVEIGCAIVHILSGWTMALAPPFPCSSDFQLRRGCAHVGVMKLDRLSSAPTFCHFLNSVHQDTIDRPRNQEEWVSSSESCCAGYHACTTISLCFHLHLHALENMWEPAWPFSINKALG